MQFSQAAPSLHNFVASVVRMDSFHTLPPYAISRQLRQFHRYSIQSPNPISPINPPSDQHGSLDTTTFSLSRPRPLPRHQRPPQADVHPQPRVRSRSRRRSDQSSPGRQRRQPRRVVSVAGAIAGGPRPHPDRQEWQFPFHSDRQRQPGLALLPRRRGLLIAHQRGPVLLLHHGARR